jgi:NAD(P)-dependent dehydrogenase (short-subunit alcohol dehydrogenase family)
VSPVFSADALAGKVGIVTGAASGIERATAQALVAAGAVVIVADLDERGGRETIALSRGSGGASFTPVDVTDAESVGTLVDTVVQRHGRLDFAHNNAGITIA